jgi:hypothetical protein
VYQGGTLWEEQPGSQQYKYEPGRGLVGVFGKSRDRGFGSLTNNKVWACGIGFAFWGAVRKIGATHVTLRDFEAHDVRVGTMMFGNTQIDGAVLTGHSGNDQASDLPGHFVGFQLYDTDQMQIFKNVVCNSADRADDRCLMDHNYHNRFTPAGQFMVTGMAFVNTPVANRFKHDIAYHPGGMWSLGREGRPMWGCEQDIWDDPCNGQCSQDSCAGRSKTSNLASMIDNTGTAVAGSGVSFQGGAILGSDDSRQELHPDYGGSDDRITNDWWRLDNDCHHQTDWGFWVCPRDLEPRREVVSIMLYRGEHETLPDDISWRVNDAALSGTMHHFGNSERKVNVGMASNPILTGACCDIGWYLYLDGKSERDITIFLDQMVPEAGLILAITYQTASNFGVRRCVPGWTPCEDVQNTANLEDVIKGAGDTYFVDNKGNIYVKLVNPKNGYFKRDEAKLLNLGNRWAKARYHIHSSNSGSVGWSLPDALPNYRANPVSR